VIDNTERDALQRLIYTFETTDLGDSLAITTRDSYALTDAVLAWLRENGYEKREPVVVDDAMVERAAEGVWNRYGDLRMFKYAPSYLRGAFLRDARAALVAALTPDGQEKDQPIRCDYCGGALPSIKSRAHIPTTRDLQRLGFAADKVVCPECAAKARTAQENRNQ